MYIDYSKSYYDLLWRTNYDIQWHTTAYGYYMILHDTTNLLYLLFTHVAHMFTLVLQYICIYHWIFGSIHYHPIIIPLSSHYSYVWLFHRYSIAIPGLAPGVCCGGAHHWAPCAGRRLRLVRRGGEGSGQGGERPRQIGVGKDGEDLEI